MSSKLNDQKLGQRKSQTKYLLLPNKAYITEIGLHLIKLLFKGVPRNTQTSQVVATTIGFSTETDSKTSLLNTYTAY